MGVRAKEVVRALEVGGVPAIEYDGDEVKGELVTVYVPPNVAIDCSVSSVVEVSCRIDVAV